MLPPAYMYGYSRSLGLEDWVSWNIDSFVDCGFTSGGRESRFAFGAAVSKTWARKCQRVLFIISSLQSFSRPSSLPPLFSRSLFFQLFSPYFSPPFLFPSSSSPSFYLPLPPPPLLPFYPHTHTHNFAFILPYFHYKLSSMRVANVPLYLHVHVAPPPNFVFNIPLYLHVHVAPPPNFVFA